MDAQPRMLRIVTSVLKNFGLLSGLRITDSKSLFVPIALNTRNAQYLQTIVRCPQQDFPITYLGLPLSFKKLKKVHFQPLLNAVHSRLQGWKARFLSMGGRLVLVKAVITALPLYFMQAIKLPTWLINDIDRARRSFFWKGKEKCLGGHCLVNWTKCCLPKRNGGLGILDLCTQNEALLAKWIWNLKTQQQSVWATTLLLLYGTTNIDLLAQSNGISTGLRDILRHAHLARSSITQQGTWRWTTNGQYSASSLYRFQIDSGVQANYARALWKCKAPIKVKVFAWLLFQDRILTQQNLQKRGWPSIPACVLCNGGQEETADHLFLRCRHATRLWTVIAAQLNTNLNHGLLSVEDFWLHNRKNSYPTGTCAWDTFCLASFWEIWKARNAKIFSNKDPFLPDMAMKVELAARQWMRNI